MRFCSWSRRLPTGPPRRRTPACPNDATGGEEEAPDYQRTHHSESESSVQSFNNPREHAFPTPKLPRRPSSPFHRVFFSNVSPRCPRLPPREAPNRFRECPENSHTTSRALWPSFHPIISSLALKTAPFTGGARRLRHLAGIASKQASLRRFLTSDCGMERRPQSSARCRVWVFIRTFAKAVGRLPPRRQATASR